MQKFLIELNVIEIEIRMFYKINKSMVIEFSNITKITLSHRVLSWDGLLYFSFLSTKILKSISPEREIKGRNGKYGQWIKKQDFDEMSNFRC